MRARRDIYPHFARVARALAHPKRVQILVWLFQAPRTVESLAEELEDSTASTSAHLKVLREGQLIRREKRGRHVYHAPASEEVARLLEAVRTVAETEVAAVREAVREDREAAPLFEGDLSKLRDAVDAEAVIVVDVRDDDEHRRGHIAGAMSVPFAGLPGAIPRDRPIVVYCRGPYCPKARAAAQRLREEGFDATVLRAGIAEWRAARMPIVFESSSPRHLERTPS